MQGKSLKRIVGYMLMLMLAVAVLVLFWKFGNRNHYVFGTLLIICGMLPIVCGFEKKKPSAREIVMISVMSALAVVSRMAFAIVPHFKPMAGIVMITGMAFGPTAGFLSGMISLLVSNFAFAQGPWTPWQMFAFGVGGFIAGLLYDKGIIGENKRLITALIGGIIVVLLVGPIMDTSTFFLADGTMGAVTPWAIYLSGLPVNAVHAAATVGTLLLVGPPILERINRIKVKYEI
ncbi:MAG: ECF transporter S component [Clostridium sp.]|nr:ECF transporter S component [Clostridium sp.]MCM1399024.1 ECF transporter S component [Clostridium sp.]MCM1458883.1 ECF transporter S component [Bacteroides sp.]